MDEGNFEFKTEDATNEVELMGVKTYKNIKVYLMRFKKTLFSYFFWFNDNLWFAHIEVKPDENKKDKEMTLSEINTAAGVVFTAATATIDMQIAELEKAKAGVNNEETKVS